MNKKLIVIGIAIVIVLGGGAVAYAAYDNVNKSGNLAVSSSPNVSDGTPEATQPAGSGTAITVTGKMTCLTPKDTSGPVNASCAIGLTGDDGKNYGLGADDPLLLSAPTGQQVKVVGSFTEQTSIYDSAGVIKVESLERQ